MDGSIPPPSTTTTSTTSSITTIPTSSSTVFRPRKSEDWNEYRTAIESLYRDNQLKLRDVKRIMERDYNFVASYSLHFSYLPFLPCFLPFPLALVFVILLTYWLASPVPLQQYAVSSFHHQKRKKRTLGYRLPLTFKLSREKQYKDRLAAWHVRKNIKAKEVHVMIRKQQKRAARGKQTGFRVAGQEVDSKRISRFVRRYGSNMEANNSREDPPHSPQGHQIIQPVQPVQPIQATSPEPVARNSLRYELFYPTARGTSNDIITFNRNTVTFPARSLSVSSGTMTNDITKPMTDGVQGPDGWMTLEMFQEKLLKLSRTLDQSMSRFVPAEDRSHQPSNSDQHSRSIGQ
ncbi:Clr5 domain-containing protein [Aspergillus vadensis CBS 113365]|uniref:Clr5 domain-containing protein n=1 Tax=Aspergillus vadensis (strain CBS 113365 / IMI 142717 / IBT 24658) TaxID=1448311 RepID=A0A319CA68_ASPVC|nr:hypothetical protein BO88DRAFT_423101 [Aspergillus vadensis CBS 113365]PYH72268.1 hypothetical protein BO88DRAFT_423101 [Aspergillus vadensis CBS 113365]